MRTPTCSQAFSTAWSSSPPAPKRSRAALTVSLAKSPKKARSPSSPPARASYQICPAFSQA